MSISLYMDEHVHRAITSGLRLRSVDILTVQEDHRRNVDDDILLDHAAELQRIMFSQDEDLLVEATRRQRNGTSFTGVIFAHQLHVPIGICVRDLELIAKAASLEDLVNRVEFLPL